MSDFPGLRGALLATGLLAGLGAPACGGGGGGRTHDTDGASWTLLVYMVADNNLEPFGLQDIAEMAAVGSGPGLDILVQADRAAGYSEDGLGALPDWQSAKRLRVLPDALEELEDLGELNMGDPSTLADFVRWGLQAYPADRVGVIFWDHGASWPGFGGDESTPDHDMLDLGELALGLQQGLEAGGRRELALLGFDACLMAAFETAASLAPYGEYLLASEELEPGHGWDYRELAILAGDPTTRPDALARALLAGFQEQAGIEGTGQDITLSLLDLYEVDHLRSAVSSLASALRGALDETGPSVGQQRAQALEFARMPDPAQSFHMVDLGDLAAALGEAEPGLAQAAAGVRAALQRVVLDRVGGPVQARATGLSIYFPPQAAYYNAAYDQVAAAVDWREFLQAYYLAAGQAGAGPVFTNPDHQAEVGLVGGELLVQGQLSPGSLPQVAQALLYAGVVSQAGDALWVLAELPAVVDATGLVSGSWDASAAVVGQGGLTAEAYLALSEEQGYLLATLPFGYQPPGSQELGYALLSRVYDPDTGVELQTTFYLVGEGGVGELEPEPGSALWPLLQVVDLQTGEAGFQVTSQQGFDPTQPLDLGLEPLPAGTQVYLELDAYDFAGQSDYVSWLGAL